LTPPKIVQNSRHIEISNKVTLVFDRLKAKQFKAMGKSRSMTSHWLYKTILDEQKCKRRSIKSSRRKEASTSPGAQVKSWKHKIFRKERSLYNTRGPDKIMEMSLKE
jgi:hypothetical protein